MIIPNKEHINLYLDLFDKNLQNDILQEECAELIKALSKIKRKVHSNNTRQNLIEEISHVLISLYMVCEINDISDSEIKNEFDKKYNKYTNMEV
jgi:NTP pyrophosphatase (non-canonical NTP hydrolase)